MLKLPAITNNLKLMQNALTDLKSMVSKTKSIDGAITLVGGQYGMTVTG